MSRRNPSAGTIPPVRRTGLLPEQKKPPNPCGAAPEPTFRDEIGLPDPAAPRFSFLLCHSATAAPCSVVRSVMYLCTLRRSLPSQNTAFIRMASQKGKEKEDNQHGAWRGKAKGKKEDRPASPRLRKKGKEKSMTIRRGATKQKGKEKRSACHAVVRSTKAAHARMVHSVAHSRRKTRHSSEWLRKRAERERRSVRAGCPTSPPYSAGVKSR